MKEGLSWHACRTAALLVTALPVPRCLSGQQIGYNCMRLLYRTLERHPDGMPLRQFRRPCPCPLCTARHVSLSRNPHCLPHFCCRPPAMRISQQARTPHNKHTTKSPHPTGHINPQPALLPANTVRQHQGRQHTNCATTSSPPTPHASYTLPPTPHLTQTPACAPGTP